MHTHEAAQVTHTQTHRHTELTDFLLLNVVVVVVVCLRLDGSTEPANEILEQGSHDRPLVAQTYSAAVTKGTSHSLSYEYFY